MMFGKAATILLVEDIRLHMEIEKEFLRRLDVRVVTSGRGRQALAVARAKHPDLVVLDIREPGRVGLDLCRDLKADAVTGDIPVVVVTDRRLHDDSRDAGADALVFTPITEREFVGALRRFVPLPERHAIRCVVNLRFTFVVDDEVRQAFCRDLSSSGVYLKTDRMMQPGSELQLRFRLPGEERDIGCRGVVRHAQTHPRGVMPRGIGVEFLDIAAEDRRRVEEFIETVRH